MLALATPEKPLIMPLILLALSAQAYQGVVTYLFYDSLLLTTVVSFLQSIQVQVVLISMQTRRRPSYRISARGRSRSARDSTQRVCRRISKGDGGKEPIFCQCSCTSTMSVDMNAAISPQCWCENSEMRGSTGPFGPMPSAGRVFMRATSCTRSWSYLLAVLASGRCQSTCLRHGCVGGMASQLHNIHVLL